MKYFNLIVLTLIVCMANGQHTIDTTKWEKVPPDPDGDYHPIERRIIRPTPYMRKIISVQVPKIKDTMQRNDLNKFDRLKGYLEGNEIATLSETQLDDIFDIVLKSQEWSEHVGHRVGRIQFNAVEKAFHEVWLKWNEPRPGVDYGMGILQDLFIEPAGSMFFRKWVAEISSRERWIVATIIQWLGTAVGMSFLNEALRKVDMQITPLNKGK